MTRLFANSRSRYVFAAIAGTMIALAFPHWSIAGFAWIAPGLMLFCACGKTSRPRFWIGYVAGLTFYLTLLYWLLNIPFPAGAVAGWLALSAYCALYPALWVWLCWRIFETFFISKTLVGEAGANVSFVENFLRTTWTQRFIWSLSCAVFWVALEMTLARLFTGFPWSFLGITQYKIIPLLQIASYTGIYGVSFLLVWFAVSLCGAGILLANKPQPSRVWSAEIICPALITAVVFAFGFKRIAPDDALAPKLKVALIQPSIPQTLIFDPSQNEKRFAQVMQLSESALAEKPDVLIWPEASLPDAENLRAVTSLLKTYHVWMIFGADDVAIRSTSDGLETNYFNSCFLFSPGGTPAANYRKRRLVIFGEYIPLVRWMPFMKWITPIDGGFTAGDGPVPFKLDSPNANISPLICFEDVFPHYAREHAAPDTDFLLNLTNDGWFGESAEQWQQAANAVYRAVENGLPLVRCTNNGLTCWIDQFGRMRKIFRGESGSVYDAGFLMAEIPLLPPGEKRFPTFYNRHGDVFGWGCVALSALLTMTSFRFGNFNKKK